MRTRRRRRRCAPKKHARAHARALLIRLESKRSALSAANPFHSVTVPPCPPPARQPASCPRTPQLQRARRRSSPPLQHAAAAARGDVPFHRRCCASRRAREACVLSQSPRLALSGPCTSRRRRPNPGIPPPSRCVLSATHRLRLPCTSRRRRPRQDRSWSCIAHRPPQPALTRMSRAATGSPSSPDSSPSRLQPLRPRGGRPDPRAGGSAPRGCMGAVREGGRTASAHQRLPASHAPAPARLRLRIRVGE